MHIKLKTETSRQPATAAGHMGDAPGSALRTAYFVHSAGGPPCAGLYLYPRAHTAPTAPAREWPRRPGTVHTAHTPRPSRSQT